MIKTLLLTALAFLTANAFAATCDRTCLQTTLDQYLKALVDNEPSAAPLSIAFRQTENAVVTIPGTGLWQSATALGKLYAAMYYPPAEAMLPNWPPYDGNWPVR